MLTHGVPDVAGGFSRVTAEDISFLRSICGPERVRVGEDIPDDFARDELATQRAYPEVLVEPVTTEEVSSILKYANERRIPVTPRGSGTGLCGAAVSIHGGLMLSTARMDRILEIDEDNLMATVQPGVILMNFQERIAKLGLMYPPDPGEKSATIGGNVMTNAGGMRAVKYGVTRDYVVALEAVMATGETVRLGGKVVKNSSGYNLFNLMIGSEGTLGVVTEITVRLVPLPKRTTTLLVPFPSLESAIGTVPKIIRSRIVPNAIEFMQREIIGAAEEYLGKKFPHSTAPAYLLLRFDGNSPSEMEEVCDEVGHICLESGADDVLIADTSDRQEVIWETRGAFLEALKAMSEIDEVDVVVPRNQIANFVRFTEDLRKKHQIRILSFGHAGDGNLHVYALRDDLEEAVWKQKLEAVMDEMYAEGRRLGGLVSGEHGIGMAKKKYLVEFLGNRQIELQRALRRVFDPNGILNPGKVV